MWSLQNKFAIILIALATISVQAQANPLSDGELLFARSLYEVTRFVQIFHYKV